LSFENTLPEKIDVEPVSALSDKAVLAFFGGVTNAAR
jgi:hypothetical protein